MSLKKLWTALKGGSNEVVEAIADSQSIRILDQEMREAKEELVACDQNLTKIMAKRKTVWRTQSLHTVRYPKKTAT